MNPLEPKSSPPAQAVAQEPKLARGLLTLDGTRWPAALAKARAEVAAEEEAAQKAQK
jgi:hypothetical protein